MKKCIFLLLALIFIFSSRLWADDTEIYGAATISITPNILIIFDTSGSMTTADIPGIYYDPGTSYTGPYTNATVYERTHHSYTQFASSVGDLNCSAVVTDLTTKGYSSKKIRDYGQNYVCGGTKKRLFLGNWLNYDVSGIGTPRTRTEVAKEVVTTIINNTDDVRFGLMRFNYDQGGYIVEECGTEKSVLLTAVSGLPASGMTPLAETLAEAGLYFAGKATWFNGSFTYTSPMQYRCQKNYIILMTDGQPTQDLDPKLSSGTYINGDTIGDYDNDGNDPGVYGSYGSDYLDDVAKYLYENDLNSSLGTSGESFEKQNIITYTIGFKTDQQLLEDTAINGGGQYFTANSISGLYMAFEEIMSDIADVNAVYVSPVVPVSRTNRTFAGNSLYVGFFKPQVDGRWSGNIKKYGLNGDGAIVDADGILATLSNGAIKDNARSFWSVSDDGPDVLLGGVGALLVDQASRNLYTYMGSVASLTDSSNAFSTANTDITPAILDVSTDTEKDEVINDIHGAARDWILGDILHSKPSVVHYDINGDGTPDESFIFAGNNDGIMHCFKDSDGSEIWGFIPPDQLTRLKLLSDGTTVHDYFVDGAPVVYEGGGQKILFFGERRGGSDYYALDITTYNAPSYLYQIASDFLVGVDGIDATLGQSWCAPTVHNIKTSSGSDTVFLLSGGYDTNQDLDLPIANDSIGKAVFAIKASNGTLSSLNVNAGNYGLMTHCFVDVSGFDTSGDGFTNRVYAGDLGGNVFAFEDDDGNGTWSERKLFSASAVDSVQRKIFYSPDAVAESFGGTPGEMIFFGTGDRADPEETTVVNRIYAVKNPWEDPATFTTITESDLTDVTDDLIVLGTAQEKIDARNALLNSKGWFIQLENLGEKVTSSITVFNGVVYFTTYTPESGSGGGGDPCVIVSGRGEARLYALNYKTGEAAFEYCDDTETDGDGNDVTQGKLDRCKVIGTSIASAPVIAVLPSGPQIYIGVEGGVLTENPNATVSLNTYYWRQLND
jgi:type IV pilus assembly protein PilY1